MKILVVDDEQEIVEFLTYNLKKAGFIVFSANNGYDAIQEVQRVSPHLVLLDIMMPGIDGIETCERIKENPKNKDLLVVFLTARSEEYSQVAGFTAGADDFVIKPIRPRVLIARLKALLKRFASVQTLENQNNQILQFNDLIIDLEKYSVNYKDKEIILQLKEFRLLQLLTSQPSTVFTREEIYEQLWGSDVFVSDRTIDVYVSKLREKIGGDQIVTIKGVGYKFVTSKAIPSS
jgi:two-component system, OmpR family, alkaline phosphatase synthesis response regulator PhoP